MKTTLLLATALFLVSSPEPDSDTISEVSAGFLSQTGDKGLMAAELFPRAPASGISDYRCIQKSYDLKKH